jgi:hypothetical protein
MMRAKKVYHGGREQIYFRRCAKSCAPTEINSPCPRVSVVILLFVLLFLSSCGTDDDGKKTDSLTEDSLPAGTLAPDSIADPVVNAPPVPYKLSPEDSARVADSVARNRNSVRDFD